MYFNEFLLTCQDIFKIYPYKEKAEAKSLGFFSYKTGGTKDGSDQNYLVACLEYLRV